MSDIIAREAEELPFTWDAERGTYVYDWKPEPCISRVMNWSGVAGLLCLLGSGVTTIILIVALGWVWL